MIPYMQKLLSLPPNLVSCFHELEGVDRTQWFCTSDPIGSKLGSGGGTTWLLEACRREYAPGQSFGEWLGQDKRILLHAGGQSRRLPAYAPSGKILTPVPIFRWERGQRLSQNLLSLQLPLYEKIMTQAPDSLHTLIASGDVYIRSEQPLQAIPEADVVCYGLWVDPELASHHGVFASHRQSPDRLDFMLQKPTLQELEKLSKTHFYLMDIGIWLLSDRAVEVLMKRSRSSEGGELKYYDMYSDFGRALGEHPALPDDEVNTLSVAILPLPGGEFYHYGTNEELISSTLAVQSRVRDQRQIMHRKVKPHPAMFVMNAEVHISLTEENENIWIENSCVGPRWEISSNNIITGVPENDWEMFLGEGTCLDMVPVGESGYAIRMYDIHDKFRGRVDDENTDYLDLSFCAWMDDEITYDMIGGEECDIQSARIFPVVHNLDHASAVIRWIGMEWNGKRDPAVEALAKEVYFNSERLSADEISARANLKRLYAQREAFRRKNWTALAANYENSVFYQLDLADAAREYVRMGLEAPQPLPADAAPMQRMRNHMLRSRIFRGQGQEHRTEERAAFDALRDAMMSETGYQKKDPVLSVYPDQIVWGRSPVRIDLAGGWTDTPPYSLYAGGNVVNIAIELNGQPPLQVYVKPCQEHCIILRSIDMGASETIHTYEELARYDSIGSPFSIPKAALCLAGFDARFSNTAYASLQEQLQAFGSGMEVTLLAAIPAGSGLGTSSILASTVLGALNDFCGLTWDKNEICRRTLLLEQLLTTGGGWQDQYGGVLQGIKLLQTEEGFCQDPQVRWLPNHLFTHPDYRMCHLLYYTGITRTAKDILGEIVGSMFLNSSTHLQLLAEMKSHALEMNETIRRGDFEGYGRLIGKTWEQNKALDSGTNPPAVEAIIDLIKEYALGYKLPGAGGGGYLYIVARDAQAAVAIRRILNENPPNPRARFVEMTLSDKGFQVSRS